MDFTNSQNNFLTKQILNSFQGVVFFALDANYRYLFFNENHFNEMKKIWGVEIKQGDNMLDFIKREDDRKKAKENFDRALAGESFTIEEAYGDEEHERLYYEIDYAPLKDEEGKIIGLTVSLREITERKKRLVGIEKLNERLEAIAAQKTQELQDDKEKFRLLFDVIGEAVLVHRQGVILFANKATIKIAGVKRLKDLIGQNILDFIDLSSKKLVEDRFELLSKYGEMSLPKTAIKLKRADGTIIWIEVFSRKIMYENKDAILTIVRDINERIEAERKIKQSRDTLKKLLNFLPEMIVIHYEGKVLFVNDTVLRTLGYSSKDEIIGQDVIDFVHPDSREMAAERIEKLKKETELVPIVKEKLLRKDGSWFWAEVVGRRIVYENKEVILVSARDITEIVEAEKKIKEIHKIYYEAIKNIGGVPYSYNYYTKKYDFIGEGVNELFEIPTDDFNPIKFKSLVKEIVLTDFPKLKDPHEATKLMKGGEVSRFNADYKIQTPSGKIKWISDRSVAIKNPITDEVIGALGIMQDITTRKLREAELKKREELLSTIIAQSSDGLLLLDENFRVVEWNKALENFVGMKREEILNKDLKNVLNKIQILKPEDNISKISLTIREDIKSLLTGKKKEINREWLLKNANGKKIYLQTSTFVVQASIGKLSCTLFKNISRQKEIEENLRKAKELAEKSNRMKSEFLAQVSHEIRTPLNIILSFSQLLRDELQDKIDDYLKEGFDSIQSAGNRLIRTIDLILGMSELQTNSYEPNPKKVDIYTDILEPLKHEFQVFTKQKGLALIFENKADDSHVVTDHFSVTKILENLIDNAIKYTNKGEVKVTVYRQEDGHLAVSVKDTGKGISKEYLPHIFEPFSQEEHGYSRRFEGNGLGLALVKEYCRLNKIEIKVDSEVGKGTTFTIVFP